MWEVECPCGEKPGLELLRAGHMQMCSRTHADVRQDPADEDTSETSYVDVGMGKTPPFHLGVGVRAPGVPHEDLLLARKNSPEWFLRSSWSRKGESTCIEGFLSKKINYSVRVGVFIWIAHRCAYIWHWILSAWGYQHLHPLVHGAALYSRKCADTAKKGL